MAVVVGRPPTPIPILAVIKRILRMTIPIRLKQYLMLFTMIP